MDKIMGVDLKRIAFIACLPLSSFAAAQFTLSAPSSELGANPAKIDLRGKAAFDLVRLEAGKFTFPLRFGHVVARSETVDVDGRTLRRDVDYTIDNESGTIYLKGDASKGQSMRVSYRYDNAKANEGVYGGVAGSSASAFTFTFAPGAKAIVGMGYTERLADGSVLTGNVFGLNNSFKLAGGTLKGVMMVNSREKSKSQDLTGLDTRQSSTEDGTGMAILQELDTGALGGRLKASYQDIEDKFAGFNALSSAGYDQNTINTLAKEKGLKRSSFQLSDAGAGAFRFGAGLQTVGDSAGSITWRNANLKLGSASFVWASQYVDPGFTKFNGLREQDRQQLMKEKGLTREAMSLNAPWKGGKFTYDFLSVSGQDDIGLWRSALGLDTGWFKASYSQQSIDPTFSRFNDLREGDRGQLAKEQGVTRENLALSFDRSNVKAGYLSSSFGTDEAGYQVTSTGLKFKGFEFSAASVGVDEGFNRFGSLTGDDRNLMLSSIVGLYGAALKPQGRDNEMLNRADGLGRKGWRLNYTSGSWLASFQNVQVSSGCENSTLQSAQFTKGETSLSLSNQQSTAGFGDFNRLTQTEQQILGTTPGLDKQTANFSTKFGKDTSLRLGYMKANGLDGGAFRTGFNFARPGLDVSYARRGVDKNFGDVGRLVDPEANILQSILGFDQTDVVARWQPTKGLSFSYRQADAIDSILDQMRGYRESSVQWRIGPKTSLSMSEVLTRYGENGELMVDQQIQGAALSHNMGKAGKLDVSHETRTFSGNQDTLPDARTSTVSYETNITGNTSIKTSQSLTQYEDGGKETTSSNTIKTQVNPRLGLSVTDTKIRRDGDKPDETYRDYGFWIDFGSGIRLDWMYDRDLKGEDGQLRNETTISGGQAGGIKLESGGYKHYRADGKRDRHLGNVNFANVTPFQLGFVRDLRFYYRTDTERDYYAWKREIIQTGATFSLGNLGVGYDYFSQINANGNRAIDRSVTVVADKTGKGPLQASMKYGVRTLPNNDDVMIRDYQLKWSPNKFWVVNHAMVTNPVQQRGDVLLGSLPMDERRSTWAVKYQNDPKLAFDLSWNEIKRKSVNESLRREARANMVLFADNPSPLTLTYALQQWDRNNNRYLAHSYGISFNQRPGPNQMFSFSLEHIDWVNGRPADPNLRDWSMRLDYNIRF